MAKTLNHVEGIDDLIQMDDAMCQDLDDAIATRRDELISELNLLEEDIIEYSSSIEVKITIKYKDTAKCLNSN